MKWSTRKFLLLIELITLSGLAIYYFYPEPALPPGVKIDKLVVDKSDRTMKAFSNNQLVKTYSVSLGKHDGKKEKEGDKRTPEGAYIINDKNPGSGFHKNLGISYPNASDLLEAKKKNVNPGSEVKIHGLKNGLGFIGKFHRLMNWTAGCIAVTDDEIDELYGAVIIGTPILISE